VATVYGVGVSNIILIPAGNKIKARIEQQVELQQLMLEGVIGIIEGLNPKLIRSKLEAFQVGGKASPKTQAARATAGVGRPVAVEN
jgi:chemotaxis protein MotA